MSLNRDKHRARHVTLHQALDELFADYIAHHPQEGAFTVMPLIMLIEWSKRQTVEPDELPTYWDHKRLERAEEFKAEDAENRERAYPDKEWEKK